MTDDWRQGFVEGWRECLKFLKIKDENADVKEQIATPPQTSHFVDNVTRQQAANLEALETVRRGYTYTQEQIDMMPSRRMPQP